MSGGSLRLAAEAACRAAAARHHNRGVLTAGDGETALNIMRQTSPQVVLMDMNLPIKDGWTASREAQLEPRLQAIPIIALTAHAMEEDKARALEAGCCDYATKPVDFPELLTKIAAHHDADR